MTLRILGLASLLALLPLGACTKQGLATVVDSGVVVPDGGPVGESLTYWDDILPLTQQHCTMCHQDGGSAPFSFLDESAIKSRILLINSMVGSGEMPPWRPKSGCRDLQGARTMSQADTQKILDWSSNPNAKMGTAPSPLPEPTSVQGLAHVDRTLQVAAAYTPATTMDEPDHYQCFILDPQLTADTDLIGYDVKPGMVKEVHHVLLFPADPTEAQQLDDNEPGPGWTCFGGPGTQNPTTVGGWVPGSSAVTFPTDTGIALKAGQVLVMQIHYNTNYVSPSPDQSTLELMFASTPVAKHAVILPVVNTTFSIPPGAQNQAVTASVKSPVNATVWGVLPHAHTHAVQMHVQSDAGCMIDIPQWEFQWQQLYFFSDPMTVAKGQSVNLTCTFTNNGSTTLHWGETTEDEMCLNYLYVTP